MHFLKNTDIIELSFIYYRYQMKKKLAVFALMGTTTLMLTGCSLGGVTPEQYAQQTQILIQMQQDMKTLLSGMDALRAQNAALSGTLSSLRWGIGLPILTHGAADEKTGEMDLLGSNNPKDAVTPTVTDIKIPLPTVVDDTSTKKNNTGKVIVSTGSENTGVSLTGVNNSGGTNKPSILDELKKTNSDKVSTGTNPLQWENETWNNELEIK